MSAQQLVEQRKNLQREMLKVSTDLAETRHVLRVETEQDAKLQVELAANLTELEAKKANSQASAVIQRSEAAEVRSRCAGLRFCALAIAARRRRCVREATQRDLASFNVTDRPPALCRQEKHALLDDERSREIEALTRKREDAAKFQLVLDERRRRAELLLKKREEVSRLQREVEDAAKVAQPKKQASAEHCGPKPPMLGGEDAPGDVDLPQQLMGAQAQAAEVSSIALANNAKADRTVLVPQQTPTPDTAPSGKGVGKGKGPPAPPQPKKPPVPKASAGRLPTHAAPLHNGLVNVAWRETVVPNESDLNIANDDFLRSISHLASAAAFQESHQVHECPRLSRWQSDRSEYPEHDTVFRVSNSHKVPELSVAQLRYWFSTRHVDKKDMSEVSEGLTFLDQKTMQNIGILLSKVRMKSKHDANQGILPVLAVDDLRRGVLCCGLACELLGLLEKVNAFYHEDGGPLQAFVETSGVEALDACKNALEHKLVYQICRIPALERRLRCMTFELQWNDTLRKCRDDLRKVYAGLRTMAAQRPAIQTLLRTAMRLGNALNRDGIAPRAERGFRLSSWPKFVQLKSTAKPQCGLLHFILALMSPTEIERFAAGATALAAARDARSGSCLNHSRELLQGHLSISKDCNVVPRCRRPKAPSKGGSQRTASPCRLIGLPAAPCYTAVGEEVDPDDYFHQNMYNFLMRSRSEAYELARFCQDVHSMYWQLAVYFEEPAAVYPPPQGDVDKAHDLCAMMCDMAEQISKAHAEVRSFRLREELDAALRGEPIPSFSIASSRIPTPRQQTMPEPSVSPPIQVRTAQPQTVARKSSSSNSTSSMGPSHASEATSRGAVAVRRLRESPVDCEVDEGKQSDVSDWDEQEKAASQAPTPSPSTVPMLPGVGGVLFAAVTSSLQRRRRRPAPPTPSTSPPRSPCSPSLQSTASVSSPNQRMASAAIPAEKCSVPCPRHAVALARQQAGGSSDCSPSHIAGETETLEATARVLGVSPHWSPGERARSSVPAAAPVRQLPPMPPMPPMPLSGQHSAQRGQMETERAEHALRVRKSLSQMADRVECEALIRLGTADGVTDVASPLRRRTRARSQARPDDDTPEPISVQIAKEVKRRSMSAGCGHRTPLGRHAASEAFDLTPVDEPGETPNTDPRSHSVERTSSATPEYCDTPRRRLLL